MSPEELRYARDTRESPILAIVHLFPLITAHTKVVPEKSVSILESRKISVSHLAITSDKAALISFAKSL